ncbi:MAG: single-stranded-DNA-specific exonuclease RecJ [Erysipelotrichaceae bacterium]
MIYIETDVSDYQKLMKTYSINSLLAKVISAMKYEKHDIASFFNPLEQFELESKIFEPVRLALETIKKEKKKVFIFGDYDCDGICGTTIVKKILDNLEIENGFYIPDRLEEGYGLSLEKLKMAYEKGYEVLITVDNGVSSFKALQYAKENGITTIVTDHHIITEEAEYDFLLHPMLLKEDYRYLCGSGIVYLLACYLKLADTTMAILAMIATIADVMSLKGANVKIVKDGLCYLNQGLYKNVLALDKFILPINEEDIAFKIVPKINAVGRMADIANVNNVVWFLLSDDIKEINSLAAQIINVNNTRLKLSKEQNELVKEKLKSNDNFNLIYLPDLHEGLLGLIATRIAEQTKKLTFIMTDSQNQIKGSGRSNGIIDMLGILEDFRINTIALGGHKQACGITLEKEMLIPFRNYLEKKLYQHDNEATEEYIEVNNNDLTADNIKELFSYRPFGHDRSLPLLKTVITDVVNYSSMKNEYQLKWKCKDLDFISFSNKGFNYYKEKEKIEIYGYLQENIFKGKTGYQIIIKEIIE